MSTYILCLKIIKAGNLKKEKILSMLDVFLANSRITANEYNELIALIEEGE